MNRFFAKPRKATLFFCAVMILVSTEAWSRVAVLPYRVAVSSDQLTPDSGRDYGRLLALTLRITKKIDVASNRNVSADLTRARINYRKKITADDLVRLGAHGLYEYILLGTLSTRGAEIQSRSILYSVREKRVLMRFKSTAGNLPLLAQKDLREAFASYRARTFDETPASLDLLVMVDLSANIRVEWPSVRRDLLKRAGELIDSAGIDTRLYILPFGEKYSYRHVTLFHNNLQGLKNHLKRLNPRGAGGGHKLLSDLSRGINNIRWRSGAVKKIVLISNSSITGKGYPEHFGMMARKKGITITSILMGKLNHVPGEKYHRLSSSSGGNLRYLSYRQRVYDANGSPHWLYFQRGRLLHGEGHDASWRRGILTYSRYRPAYGKPRVTADELYSDRPFADPYTIVARYDRLSGKRIIKSEALEHNLLFHTRDIFTGSGISSDKGGSKRRVLLSDGTLSLWMNVSDKKLFNLLSRRMNDGSYFPLLVIPRRDLGEVYGISLLPLPVELNSSDVPKVIKTNLKSLVKNRKKYLAGSGLRPNVWVISVKVLQAKGRSTGRDIRD